MPEEATRVAQIKRGDVDIVGALSFDRLVSSRGMVFACKRSAADSANVFTSTGTTTTANDPTADQMYQAAVSELDDVHAKKLWQDLMHYGYDTMWVNLELVQVPTYFVVSPNVGAFTNRSYINMWDSYVGIQRNAA